VREALVFARLASEGVQEVRINRLSIFLKKFNRGKPGGKLPPKQSLCINPIASLSLWICRSQSSSTIEVARCQVVGMK